MDKGKVINVYSLPNTAAAAFQGAGVQTTQMIVNNGVNTIITGSLGPNASYGLQQAGVPVYSVIPGIQVSQALEMLLKNQLPLISQPGSTPMGMGRGMGRGRGMGQGSGRRRSGQNW